MTVHPMVVMFPQGEEISLLYFDVISDNLKHDGSAVKVFLNRLASHLSTNYPHVKCLHIWSDGCGVQYKSRLPMLNMSKNFEIPQKVIWNFFGSRHGKNMSDGESAVVKSHLDIVTRAKEDSPLDTALKCYEYLTGSTLASPLSSTARRHFCFVNKDAILMSYAHHQRCEKSMR